MNPNCSFSIRLALLGLALLSFSQCRKVTLISFDPPPPQPEVLPEATQEGKNTLGFLLDGKLWVARVEPFKSGYTKTWTSYYHGKVSFGGYRILGDTIKHQFVFNSNVPINRLGSYKLGYISSDGIGVVLNSSKPEGKSFYSYKDGSGTITITKLDTMNHPGIISGTFNVNIGFEKIQIREGRFDLKLK